MQKAKSVVGKRELATRGPRVLVGFMGKRHEHQARLVSALLAPRLGDVRLSFGPEDVVPPRLTLLLQGWGDLGPFPALRECELRFATPVIVIVSQRQAMLIPELLRAGAIDCARWPISDAELLARVETRMPRSSSRIALDPVALILHCGDLRARLTPSEFRVVRHLLADSSRWSTTDEITIEALRPSGSSKNLLRGIVHSIRRKLQHEAWRVAHDRQRGYRFDVSASRLDVETDESKAPA